MKDSGEVKILHHSDNGEVSHILDLETNQVYKIDDWVQYSESMKNFWKTNKKFKIKGFKFWYKPNKKGNPVYAIIPSEEDYSYKEGNEYPVYQIQPYLPQPKLKKFSFTREEKKKITDFIQEIIKTK